MKLDPKSRQFLLSLVAHAIYEQGGLADHYPKWAFRAPIRERVVHDGRHYELVTAKSERARVVFDEIVAEGRPRKFGKWREANVAWRFLRGLDAP